MSNSDPGRFIIADEYFEPILSDKKCNYITIPALESTKSLPQISTIIEALRQRNVSRDITLVAVGGGVVQDVTGFVSSIFMRGVPWIYVPTTLLGMVDSCIGGKSSVNVGPYKNIVGTFHPPLSIEIDPSLTLTLTAEQKVAGLCEAAKICFCHGAQSFETYLNLDPSIDADIATLARVIEISLRGKRWFVEADEFDLGERRLLNLGHTFGHALEAASGFRVAHGVAVGLGILAAQSLAARLGHVYAEDSSTAQLVRHVNGLLRHVPELGATLKALAVADLLDAFSADKKHNKENFGLILITGNNRAEFVTLRRDDRSLSIIGAAFSDAIEGYLEVLG